MSVMVLLIIEAQRSYDSISLAHCLTFSSQSFSDPENPRSDSRLHSASKKTSKKFHREVLVLVFGSRTH
jgi:hypothetical protein